VIGVNAGKSSLLNGLIGVQASAVSRKTNTSRKNLTVAKTVLNTQLIFYDTPGVVSSHNINTLGWHALDEASFTLFVVDAVKRLREDVLAAAARLQQNLSRDLDPEFPKARLDGETERLVASQV
jgi:GTPase Era involved in 16S rRNA processing